MYALIFLIDRLLGLYEFIVIAWVILSWLISFNVINTHNRIVYLISDFLYRVTEPALGPIRRILPNFGGIDISPIILILIIYFIRDFLTVDLPRYLG
jgi:YggT family protein